MNSELINVEKVWKKREDEDAKLDKEWMALTSLVMLGLLKTEFEMWNSVKK